MSKRRKMSKNGHQRPLSKQVVNNNTTTADFQERPLKPTIAQLSTEIATPSQDTAYLTYGNYYPNPDPVIQKQGAAVGIALYDKIWEDDHARSVLSTRCNAVVRCEWCVKPPPDASRKETKIAKTIEEILRDSNFDFACQMLLKSVLYSYYVCEVIYNPPSSINQFYTIKDFIAKHPRRFNFNSDRQLQLLTKDSPIYGVSLPAQKFMVMQYGDNDNPYADGLGRVLHWLVWFKHTQIKWWNKYAEKFAMPTFVAQCPDMTIKAVIQEALESIQTSTNLIIPDDIKITLIEANKGVATYQAACDYFNRGISKAVLGQVLTTESNNTGTYALGKVQEEVRQDYIRFDADMLDELCNKTIVAWLTALNFSIPRNRYPRIERNTEQKLVVSSLLEQAQIDKILYESIHLQIDPEYFYEKYGVWRPPTTTTNDQKMFSKQYTPQQQVVENIIDKTIDKSEHVKKAISKQLKSIIAEGASVDTIQKLIQKLIQEALLNVQSVVDGGGGGGGGGGVVNMRVKD